MKRVLPINEWTPPTRRARKQVDQCMASAMGHFRLQGSPKRKDYVPKRNLSVQFTSRDDVKQQGSVRDIGMFYYKTCIVQVIYCPKLLETLPKVVCCRNLLKAQ